MSDESYMWRMHYTDGEMYSEYADDGTEQPFVGADLTRVKAIEIVPTRPGINGAVVSIDAEAGMRPIFFRRRFIATMPDGYEVGRATATVLGWQRTLDIGGEQRNVASYTFFFEDGSVLISDDPNII